MDWIIPLVMLTGMEIVLGIDNIIFLSILVAGVEPSKQRLARYIGLALALGARMLLLLGIRFVMGLEKPWFHLSSIGFIPDAWLQSHHVDAVTGRDVVLIGGGLFLIAKSVLEIHKKMAGEEPSLDDEPKEPRASSFAGVIAQIIVLDLVFSLDSIISAIGMVKEVWIMVVAMSVAVVFMAVFAGKISRFIEAHPTFKMLALSFLVMIGVVLIAEGVGSHISRGYIYVSMAFALGVELMNMRVRRRGGKTKAPTSRRERSLRMSGPGVAAQNVAAQNVAPHNVV